MSDGSRFSYRTLLQSALALGGLPRLVPHFWVPSSSRVPPGQPCHLFPDVSPRVGTTLTRAPDVPSSYQLQRLTGATHLTDVSFRCHLSILTDVSFRCYLPI